MPPQNRLLRALVWRAPGTDQFYWALATALLLLLGSVVVYLAASWGEVSHLLYLPIALAAYRFGAAGGVATALLAGLVTAAPIGATAPLSPTPVDWFLRLLFYVAAGVVLGLWSSKIRTGQRRLGEVVGALEETHSTTLKAFSRVVEAHDGTTGEHCERVAANALALGKALNLDADRLDQLYWAGILHDVGKVAVPAEILQKPGKLTAEEYRKVMEHPAFGARLLRSITSEFEAVAQGVESHHERWDGSGYPGSLKGEEIPLFGRILAIVDVFEALTGDRPYREALDPSGALAVLRSGAGTLFDWKLVALYERLYWDGKILVAGESVGAATAEARLTTWLTRIDHEAA